MNLNESLHDSAVHSSNVYKLACNGILHITLDLLFAAFFMMKSYNAVFERKIEIWYTLYIFSDRNVQYIYFDVNIRMYICDQVSLQTKCLRIIGYKMWKTQRTFCESNSVGKIGSFHFFPF